MHDKHLIPEAQAPSIRRIAISDDVLTKIYASDQDMYPAPLTYERLKSWVDGRPELCICFETPGEEEAGNFPIGAIIVLPLLKRHWEDVLVGKLKETDIDPAMFAEDGEAEVGLHVFHIERFDAGTRARIKSFAEFALESIRDIVQKKPWNVLGYSALTATVAGREVFGRMGFQPAGYEEVFVTKTEATGDVVVDMVYVYPDRGDDVKTGGDFHSKSEMVVRYHNNEFWRG